MEKDILFLTSERLILASKKIAYFLLFIVILILIIVLIKKLTKRSVNPDIKIDEEEIKQNITKNPQKYRKIAYDLFSYMDGWGTEDEELETAIRMLTPTELKVVYNEFNQILRKKGDTGFFGWLAGGNKGRDLIEWLQEEGKDELAAIVASAVGR